MGGCFVIFLTKMYNIILWVIIDIALLTLKVVAYYILNYFCFFVFLLLFFF